MTYERRPIRPATLGPLGSLVFSRHVAGYAERLAEGLARSADPLNREAARQIRDGLQQMRDAAEEWRQRHASDAAADGNAAMPTDASSEGSAPPPSGDRLTVVQVAERVGLGPRQVRNLCQPDGPLSATKRGGTWWIDAESVDRYEAARSSLT